MTQNESENAKKSAIESEIEHESEIAKKSSMKSTASTERQKSREGEIDWFDREAEIEHITFAAGVGAGGASQRGWCAGGRLQLGGWCVGAGGALKQASQQKAGSREGDGRRDGGSGLG